MLKTHQAEFWFFMSGAGGGGSLSFYVLYIERENSVLYFQHLRVASRHASATVLSSVLGGEVYEVFPCFILHDKVLSPLKRKAKVKTFSSLEPRWKYHTSWIHLTCDSPTALPSRSHLGPAHLPSMITSICPKTRHSKTVSQKIKLICKKYNPLLSPG